MKGNSARFQFRAMPVVDRLLSDLVLSRSLPFRTKGDAMRYCVVTGVKGLLKEHEVISVTAHADAAEEALREEMFQIQFREYFTSLTHVVDHYLTAEAKPQARRVVAHAQSIFSRMPEGYWKDRYRDELRSRYGALMDGGVRASFTSEGEE